MAVLREREENASVIPTSVRPVGDITQGDECILSKTFEGQWCEKNKVSL